MRIILKCILLAAFAALFSSAASAMEYGPYTVVAPVATDGDTFRADVQIWPQQHVDTAIRPAGVDTPEIGSAKCASEKAAGIAARAFTQSWIDTHQPLTISRVKFDAYPGRYDAVVMGRDGTLLSGALIAAGHGRPYDGKSKRQSWCQ